MTSNGSYGTDSGTSMAAPMVTGAVALVEAAHPSWTMSQVVDAILDTVTPDPRQRGRRPQAACLTWQPPSPTPTAPTSHRATPDGSINSSGGFSTVQVTFNEEINPATFTSARSPSPAPAESSPRAN